MPPRHIARPSRRSHWPLSLVALIVVAALVAWLWPREALPPEAEAPVSTDRIVEDAGDDQPRYPVPEPDADADAEDFVLPALGDSDAAFLDALAALLDSGQVDALLVPEYLIPRIVASVDNLPRRNLPERMHPIRPNPGSLMVDDDGTLRLGPANDARYAQRIAQLESVPPARVVELYLRWYPRFQDAYRDLGYAEGHFNDRLVEVIDHLLQAPEPAGRPELVATEHGYAWADPMYEDASVGHRALLRVGPDNAARIKQWLRTLRAELLERTPGRADG